MMLVDVAGGGPHEINGEAWVGPATFMLAVVMWCVVREAGVGGGSAMVHSPPDDTSSSARLSVSSGLDGPVQTDH
jgi:hypothetical protein